MKTFQLFLVAILISVFWTGCMKKQPAATTGPAMKKVTGTVTYREKIALPPDAMVEVRLLDVSKQDAPGDVVNEQTILNPGQPPIPFAVEYDPARIVSDHRYAIQARISVGGELKYTNQSAYNVITNGNPTKVEVVVEPAK
jgi:putative lipoprotein